MLNDNQTIEVQADEQKKEQFNAKLTDAQLIEQIVSWERESEDFYSKLKSVWKQNDEYYLGIQTDVNYIAGKESKAVENRIWMAVETMIPIATARLPDVVVKPGSDAEKEQMDAIALQDVLNYQFDRVHIQSHAERFLRNLLLKRYGVFKVCWDKEKDDVDVKVIDSRRIRIPKHGTSEEDLAFVIEDMELSYSSLVSYFGEEKAKEVLKNVPKEVEGKIRKATFMIQEVWTNTYVVWRYNNVILDKKDNPYWEEGNSFWEGPKKPYVIKSLFETEESLLGSTDYVQQHISIQDNLNNRKRQVENISAKVGNPTLAIDSDVMSEEEVQQITNEPGAILYGKDAANEQKIRFHAPGQVPQYLFQSIDDERRAFDNIWGIHSTTRGEREGKETLGGRQLLREADLGRIDLVARQLERALDRIAEHWTQLIKVYYTDDRVFTIVGDEGVQFVKDFSGKTVGKGVKPAVKQGSTIKEDEYSLSQKAVILWQNKAIGIRTLYKMLRLPNMQQALQDYQETYQPQQTPPAIPPQMPQDLQPIA